ncbi:hypothetical protein EYF80_055536 [Liparis tanakae]|uniref:Uncharacterized protein n=1 Tax=Liparis tanakae TaxID=230148 RepID=A0A4Z2F1E5_9TELE|nr:hypothetical protein EYF80_055536 [Liparis tanakae]
MMQRSNHGGVYEQTGVLTPEIKSTASSSRQEDPECSNGVTVSGRGVVAPGYIPATFFSRCSSSSAVCGAEVLMAGISSCTSVGSMLSSGASSVSLLATGLLSGSAWPR